MNDEFEMIFIRAGLRITKPRTEIFNTLKLSDGPMSIVDIIKACPQIDRVSVYRTLSLFNKLHIITSVPHGWKHLYELASPFIPHHHHLVCNKCNELTEIRSETLEVIITDLTNEYQFEPSEHHFEIKGICAKCSRLHI